MKAAIVHDWFATYAGSERVVEQLLQIVPEADLFSIVNFLSATDAKFLGGRSVTTSFIQNLPLARASFRHYLPLMPAAIEQLDVSAYDVVISSNHAVAKGVIVGPDQLHISYVHSPIRYAWDLQHQYLAEAGLTRGLKSILTRAILHYIRLWDQAAASRVGVFVANSNYIARRIWNIYRREAAVIFPPVDVDGFSLLASKEPFYLAASRMVPYKRMALIAQAFAAMPSRKLVMVGDGTELQKVKALAGPNVEVLGYQSFDVLRDLMRRARAFVFAAEEDFGITPVEAMACGTPVIAYGRGGVLDSVIDGKTGLFFDTQSPQAIIDAVDRFEQTESTFDPVAIRSHAEYFRPERFREAFSTLLNREWACFQERKNVRGKEKLALAPAAAQF